MRKGEAKDKQSQLRRQLGEARDKKKDLQKQQDTLTEGQWSRVSPHIISFSVI